VSGGYPSHSEVKAVCGRDAIYMHNRSHQLEVGDDDEATVRMTRKVFEEIIDGFGIQHIKTPIYSPQSYAAERVNRKVLAAIRNFLNEDHLKWDAHLPEIEVAIRNTVHSATGEAPFFTTIGHSSKEISFCRLLSSVSN